MAAQVLPSPCKSCMEMTNTVQFIHLPSLSQFCLIPLFVFIIKNTSPLLPRLSSSWRKRSAVYTLQEINKNPQFLISDEELTCSSAPDSTVLQSRKWDKRDISPFVLQQAPEAEGKHKCNAKSREAAHLADCCCHLLIKPIY